MKIMIKVLVLAIFAAGTFMPEPVFALPDDSVFSQNVKEADGTSGQDTNSGYGIKTGHIQDGAVNDAKITGPISASKIQKPENVFVVAKSGGDFDSIQSAVDYVKTNSLYNHLIKVMPGYYNENVTVNNFNLYLEGSGLDNAGIGGTITIDNSWGYVSGLQLSRIIVTNGSEATIKDNWISSPGVSDGISAMNGSTLTIIGNRFVGSGCTQSIVSNDNNVKLLIKGNKFENVGCSSIYVSSAESVTILNNQQYGVAGSSGSEGFNVSANHIVVDGNMITGNSYAGLYLQPHTTALIKNNVVTGASYGGEDSMEIASGSSGTVTILNNKISGSGPTGYDIRIPTEGITANINFNVFDTSYGFTPSHLNVKSDGTPW